MALSVEAAQRRLAREQEILAKVKAEYDAAAEAYNAERIAGNVQRGTAEYLALRKKYNIASLEAQVETATFAVKEAQQELSSAEAEAQAELNAQQATVQRSDAAVRGSDSAGQIAREDAATQGDTPPAQVLTPEGRISSSNASTAGSNAIVPPLAADAQKDTNTELPTKTLAETQSITTPGGASTPLATPTNTTVQTAYKGGVGAASDDTVSTKNTTQQAVDAVFANQTVNPQPNVLDQFYSYTYNAELWLMKPSDYATLMTSKKAQKSGTLLIRSGGIPQTGGEVTVRVGSQTGQSTNSRNPFFSLDYYIDSINIKNLTTGKGTGSIHQNTAVELTVVEPNGLTLINNIKKAVAAYVGIENYAATIYVLLINFYGYDQAGNLVKVNNQNVALSGDPNAAITKVIPFTIDNITFSVNNSLVNYRITGVPTGQDVGSGQARGLIPYNIELAGSTVGQVLGGNDGVTTATATTGNTTPNAQSQANQFQQNTNTSIVNAITTAYDSQRSPAKADAATSQRVATIAGGLMGALNEFQQQLVNKGIFEVADEYKIKFASTAISGARVRKKLEPVYSTTPMTNNADPRALLDTTQAMDPNQRVVGITAGMPIIQAIDMVIRNSGYIEDQQLSLYSELTDQVQKNSNRSKVIAWHKVSIEAKQKKFDTKRNDYAYEITFVVSPYQIKGMDSPYFPTGNFTGVHKSYPYWFTGQNISVLDYQQTYNHAYRTTLSGANQNDQQGTSDLQKIRKYWFASRSSQSAQFANLRAAEPAANAAEYLYSQSDLGEVKLRILGDPSWINQGEISTGVDPNAFNYNPFLPDGTINFDAGEVLFEVVWVTNSDINLNTGLIDLQTITPNQDTGIKQSFVFRAVSVESIFSQGRFEQVLDGQLYIFPIPATTKIARSAVNETATPTLAQTQSNILNSPVLRTPVQNERTPTNLGQTATATNVLAVNPAGSNSDVEVDTSYSIADSAQTGALATALGPAPLVPAEPPAEPTSTGVIQSQPAMSFAGINVNPITNQDPQLMIREA
jgi:hypothetical protein